MFSRPLLRSELLLQSKVTRLLLARSSSRRAWGRKSPHHARQHQRLAPAESTWPHREQQWQADGRGAASAFSSCLKPLAAADNAWWCRHLVAVPPPVAPPSSLALCAHSPIHLAPTTVLSLALCVRIAGGGEGCGVNTDASRRSSPVAVQGLVGAGGRQHCSSFNTRESIGMGLAYQVAPPLACAAFKLSVEGGGVGVNTDASPCPSPVAVQEGGREAALGGDGREAALQHGNPAATRESMGLGLAFQGEPSSCSFLPLSRFAVGPWLPLPAVVALAPFKSCTHSPPSLLSAPFQVTLMASLGGGSGQAAGERRERNSISGKAGSLAAVEGGIWWWRGGALGSTPTLPHASPRWPCRDSWGREGGIAAADGNRCHKGEYRGGLGLSRSLASHQGKQQQQQQGAEGGGSAQGAGEGRERVNIFSCQLSASSLDSTLLAAHVLFPHIAG
ncbi:unnamed protein product [Closterium sp. NIES-65]|nr:unnamed protein product [Closterium sp. NIES-65]